MLLVLGYVFTRSRADSPQRMNQKKPVVIAENTMNVEIVDTSGNQVSSQFMRIIVTFRTYMLTLRLPCQMLGGTVEIGPELGVRSTSPWNTQLYVLWLGKRYSGTFQAEQKIQINQLG